VSGDPVEVRPAPAGAAMRLRVKPGARRTRLIGAYGGALKLEVAAAPEKGRANRAVEVLLAERLEIAVAAVRIVAGEISQDKVVEIKAALNEVVDRLQRLGIEARAD
jgi:uncharacterized protein